MDWLRATREKLPTTLSPTVRKRWESGSEERLIQSFLSRSLGDSPVTEISDADVRNVVDIVRQAAPEEAGRISRLLDDLVRSATRNSQEIIAAFARLQIQTAALGVWIERWIVPLQGEVNPAVLVAAENSFDAQFVPGTLRARRELGNAVKAAEFQYHRHLHRATLILAVPEAIAVTYLVGVTKQHCWLSWDTLASCVIAYGLLLVAPRMSKSLTDAVIAIGERLRR